MASLTSLKQALRQEVAATTPPSSRVPLSDLQYSTAFKNLMRGSGSATYEDFVNPQLSQLLEPLFSSRVHISVLEIGPGPKSPLGHLPDSLKKKIKKYVAYEPNKFFATELEYWISYGSDTQSPLPQLKTEPEVRRAPFTLKEVGVGNGGDGHDDRFDIVLFCHSMYGMKPRRDFIERALDMLPEGPQAGIVVVFHRDEVLDFNGLVCHQTASFPTGQVRVADNDDDLDRFASFIAGFIIEDVDVHQTIQVKWRGVCRTLGRRDINDPRHLIFHSPEIMVAFTRHATALCELTGQVPQGIRVIKNREAQARTPATIVRPTEIQHIQQCVRWALKHGVGLTVIGGGHSGHCVWPNVVAVDMSMFDKVYILAADECGKPGPGLDPLVFVEAGCKTGDVVRETMAAGLTLPLGDRPSVGMGLWLHGGIGHLSRLYGLACDAIVGAVVVSVESGQIFCIGHVPNKHKPPGAVRPERERERELLWVIRGAGANFGIVVGITCKAFAAPTYQTLHWAVSLNNRLEAQKRLSEFDRYVANKLPENSSADTFLFFDDGKLKLAATVFQASIIGEGPSTIPGYLDAFWGEGHNRKISDGVELFDAGLYVSEMHGGHAGGKTSSFKRCVFLKNIGRAEIVDRLMYAIETRPSPACYIHLLQGGGVTRDIAPDKTSFGCRNWDFACVITGVWPRNQDGSVLARSAVQWVYEATKDLLPVSSGVYSADLGPDPRDAQLAMKAFGPNLPRLVRLKQKLDPRRVLAYACSLPRATAPKVIILVTGRSCSGKDFCAEVWASLMTVWGFTALGASISDKTKREYAAATGADLDLLAHDRAYKENHRSRLTRFFQNQIRHQPELLEEHFKDAINDAGETDVLFVTGLREKAPVAKMAHLVPGSKLMEVNVQADLQTRVQRGWPESSSDDKVDSPTPDLREVDYHPGLVFKNNIAGEQEARRFAECRLLPFFHEDLQRLKAMVSIVPNFPRAGFEFRHILGISQKAGGLELCTSLLQKHFTGDWDKIDAIASCEAGGFIYASALALRINIPMALIREAGKLPPPTISTVKSSSYVASSTTGRLREQRVELEKDAVPMGGSIVVIDDVLSTGETLCAVLRALTEAGIRAENLSVMVVAEFPVHRGRELLRQSGFAKTDIQSLLVFDGA